MQAGFLIGRILVGVYYVYSGLNGLLHQQMDAAYAASKGVPMAGAAVFVAHVLLLFAGLCFLAGWKPHWGVAATVAFFIPVTFFMHAFWQEKTAQAQMMQMVNFTKNFALMGCSLMFLAIPRPWPWSLRTARRLPARV